MSGRPHPYAVVVLLDGRQLNGCGGDPADLLVGPEWVVEDIAGVRVADGSRVTLVFGADGRASGSASCNSYSGGYTITGEGLTFSRVVTTRRACAPELMSQEQSFLDALAGVSTFGMSTDGTLVLEGGGSRMTARR